MLSGVVTGVAVSSTRRYSTHLSSPIVLSALVSEKRPGSCHTRSMGSKRALSAACALAAHTPATAWSCSAASVMSDGRCSRSPDCFSCWVKAVESWVHVASRRPTAGVLASWTHCSVAYAAMVAYVALQKLRVATSSLHVRHSFRSTCAAKPVHLQFGGPFAAAERAPGSCRQADLVGHQHSC
mgnify:CR=1 FL=1